MKFLITGPGAMGCLFASRLAKAGHGVTLLDHDPGRAERLNLQGIRVEGVSGEYTVRIPVVTGTAHEKPEVVLICVKAYQTQRAAADLAAFLGPETALLTLQNGLGNLEILSQRFGKDRVIGGVTAQGATLLGPGHIRHAGEGETIIGPENSPGVPVAEVVDAFNNAGFPTRMVENVNDLIWGKLIINVGINALTAITRLKNGRLPELDGTRWVMEAAVDEALRVADAGGVRLPYPDPQERVKTVCRNTAENIASMLQDVLKQRRTEVSYINGAIVREGDKLGIPTPVNHTLTCLVQAMEETYRERIAEAAAPHAG